MSNQYSQRYQELNKEFNDGVSKAEEYRKARNMDGFIAQVKANQDVKAKLRSVWALMHGR